MQWLRDLYAWWHHWKMVRLYISLVRGARGEPCPVALVDRKYEYDVLRQPLVGTREWIMCPFRGPRKGREVFIHSSRITDMEDARVLAGYD